MTLVSLDDRRQLRRIVILAALFAAFGYFALPRALPESFSLFAIDMSLLGFIALVLAWAWFRSKTIADDERANAAVRLQEVFTRVRAGEILDVPLASGLAAAIGGGVAVGVLVWLVVEEPTWRSVATASCAVVLECFLFALWWPNRRGAKLTISATSIGIPGYGDIPWAEWRAIDIDPALRGVDTYRRLRLYSPSLPQRVLTCDWSVRWRRALFRESVRSRTLHLSFGSASQATVELIKDLCRAVAEAATGTRLMAMVPIAGVVGSVALAEVEEAEAFMRDVERRGATMSAEEIDARMRKLQDIADRSKTRR